MAQTFKELKINYKDDFIDAMTASSIKAFQGSYVAPKYQQYLEPKFNPSDWYSRSYIGGHFINKHTGEEMSKEEFEYRLIKFEQEQRQVNRNDFEEEWDAA